MFYYLSINSARQGFNRVYVQSLTKIENYQDLIEYSGDIAEYEGESLPIKPAYDETNNIIYDLTTAPTEFHSWVDGKWTLINIEGYKNFLREKYKNERQEKINENLIYNNMEFQVNESKDLENLKDVLILTSINEEYKNKEVDWILADNSVVTINYQIILNVIENFILRKEQIYMKYIEICNAIDVATTEEEFSSINFTSVENTITNVVEVLTEEPRNDAICTLQAIQENGVAFVKYNVSDVQTSNFLDGNSHRAIVEMEDGQNETTLSGNYVTFRNLNTEKIGFVTLSTGDLVTADELRDWITNNKIITAHYDLENFGLVIEEVEVI